MLVGTKSSSVIVFQIIFNTGYDVIYKNGKQKISYKYIPYLCCISVEEHFLCFAQSPCKNVQVQ